MITNGVLAVNSSVESPTNYETVLNNIIATASLTIPSPKTNENSLGYSSYLIMDIAAMTSEEHRSELTSKHSIAVSLNGNYLFK